MPLRGLQVVELAGLAPAPFCGMVLSDFGASVIRIDKTSGNLGFECLDNGKRSVALDLKHPKGVEILTKLCSKSDVVIEPFRKGIMEKLGLGPELLLAKNPRLVYARLSGFGHSGLYSSMAGHDINYLSISGLLSLFGRINDNPVPPVNLAADFGGGGLMCALGIILALLERSKSGKGQIVDASMVDGTAYLGSWLFRSQHLPIWGEPRGKNVLDTGSHYYDTYKTKDGKFMAVGAIEPQFYAELIKGLGLSEEEVPQFGDSAEAKKIFTKKFMEKTQDEWCQIFISTDACVTPILSLEEAARDTHNVERKLFCPFADNPRMLVPSPGNLLSRTPGHSKASLPSPVIGQHTADVLRNLGYSNKDIKDMEKDKAIKTAPAKAML